LKYFILTSHSTIKKIPWQKEEDHASNPENTAAASQAPLESPSIETNSNMREIKKMLAGQMDTVLSDNREIQRDDEHAGLRATTNESGCSKRAAKEGIGRCSF